MNKNGGGKSCAACCGRQILLALALTALLAPLSAHAIEPSEKLSDPGLEARARAIASELRCLVCQNQSIDDSDAPLAKDLRMLLREQLLKGASDRQAKDYIVARYGDFVLLRPPLKPETLLLWFAPLIALVAGGLALWRGYRRRVVEAPAALSAAERERLQALGVEGENSVD
jgi:cytochrome c-type biogenesis protein CcmH